jgi:hypothetical protein
MIQAPCPTRLTTRLLFLTAIAVLVSHPFPGTAAALSPSLGSASGFAILAGTAVTCTDATVTGDVGVWPGDAVTRTNCSITGTVHAADAAAQQAYLDFVAAYNSLRDNPPPCDATLTGTLAGQVLTPGVYCVDAVAKTGTLILDGDGRADASWLFLVDGALTGTNFDVVLINGADACNVTWWVRDASTMTDSDFIGTILAGAAITVTRGTFHGSALATAAVTVTGGAIAACDAAVPVPVPPPGPGKRKCNQGVGNGPEGCDPGNSNHRHPSNDERGGTPGNPGRKPGNR